MSELHRTAVVAVGGNALILDKKHEDVASQIDAVKQTSKHIADMIVQGWNVIVTHGNGPQVGFILRRNELAAGEVHQTPLDVIGADTQGSIGYMIANALDNEFIRRGIQRPVAGVVTQVVVDGADPGFTNPTKGIGGFTTEDKARQFEKEGWMVREDAGRGWRRMIASPQPLRIVELDAIKTLVEAGFIVVGVGGGGIPVVEEADGALKGVFAVIDKDRASALLAADLEADLLLISTAVEKVAINFNKPNQQWLDRMTLSEARQYAAEGHFLAGSMGPKVEAIIAFLEANPRGQALITDPPHMVDALAGKTGTWIVNE
ncbi:MAG: carbamate kinase [Caldilineae bacterium]|nr:carbamate kinase [Anaerolineae bacterium]MCB0201195.1 carbamate kinase [Anaerolineae bacterium]MCB0206284.1 carbamate kinase [Anaerolineae bacterium]MCB0252748.1 carbamate kinase [Anaerolineae bacterium]MCB9153211.1 carbamate kinase [Caldilineae bacterium]